MFSIRCFFPSVLLTNQTVAHILYDLFGFYRIRRYGWCYLNLPVCGTGEVMYHNFLHFFRSKAWSLSNLVSHWATFVLKHGEAVVAHGRVVLLGDHTHVPKDGRQMPGVVSLHQQSETQTKPSYFRGHCWGAIGVVIGTLALPFCLPLDLAIHLGLLHFGQKNKAERNADTMGTRIVQKAINFAYKNNVLSVLVFDAFFPSKAVFQLIAAT